MAIKRKVILWGVCIAALLLLVVAGAQFELGRGLRTVSVQPFATILKKVGAGIVVAKRPSPSSVQVAPPAGYLIAYENDVEGFKADAKLFDSWMAAIKLSSSVLESGSAGDWVANSSNLQYVKPENRADPWGHPFCVMRRGKAVLVISGGPTAPGSPVCRDVGITADELAEFPRKKLLQSPSGSLVLVDVEDSQVGQEHGATSLKH